MLEKNFRETKFYTLTDNQRKRFVRNVFNSTMKDISFSQMKLELRFDYTNEQQEHVQILAKRIWRAKYRWMDDEMIIENLYRYTQHSLRFLAENNSATAKSNEKMHLTKANLMDALTNMDSQESIGKSLWRSV